VGIDRFVPRGLVGMGRIESDRTPLATISKWSGGVTESAV